MTILAIIVILGAVVYQSVIKRIQWNAFAKEHHCVRAGGMEGNYNSKYSEPDKILYRCANGDEYWINE